MPSLARVDGSALKTSAPNGFSPPAAGFDEPMAMLEACHDRIRRSLALLGRLCQRVAQGRVDAAVHAAAADVLPLQAPLLGGGHVW